MNGHVYALIVVALLFGVVAGLRALTAPAVVSWAVHLGWLNPAGGWLAALGHGWVRWILTLLALAELVTDQLPTTPSRTVPMQFGARLCTGALSGAAVGSAAGHTTWGAAAGALGAVMGTFAGSRLRGGLAAAFRNDHPAALVEDAVAIGGAVLVAAVGR
jgi:uncharacterized membrane protein